MCSVCCKELTLTFCSCVSGPSYTIRPTRLARTWRSGSCSWQTRRSTSVKSLSSKFARDVQWCSSSTSLRWVSTYIYVYIESACGRINLQRQPLERHLYFRHTCLRLRTPQTFGTPSSEISHLCSDSNVLFIQIDSLLASTSALIMLIHHNCF